MTEKSLFPRRHKIRNQRYTDLYELKREEAKENAYLQKREHGHKENEKKKKKEAR